MSDALIVTHHARHRGAPERDLRRQFERLEGTVLVVDNVHDGTVLITAYRNRRALKHIRCKTKYARAV